MIGENWQLQMSQLSLRNNRLRFKNSGELPITLEEFMEYTSNSFRKTDGYPHVTGWTCKHLDLNRLSPKISPITEAESKPANRVGLVCAGSI